MSRGARLVCALALLFFAFFVWPTRYRYEKAVVIGDHEKLIRTDRLTGRVDCFFGGSGWQRCDGK